MKLKEIGAINDMPRGWCSQSIVNQRIYSLWVGMLRRVYDKWEYYKDCTCHTDFLLLSNFVKWIEQEPNYPLLVEDPSPRKWSIDKDGIVPGNKEYVPGKMQLITLEENIVIALNNKSHQKHYKSVLGVNPNSKVVFYDSLKEAEILGGYDHSTILHCIKGRRKQYKGYKWFYATDLIGVLNYFYKES